jgi:hypothetical protein
MIRLPDRDALRNYLLARFAAPEVATTAARQVTMPMTVAKRGAVIYARK